MEFNYLSLGNECSSARVLKDLHLRAGAGPFDWTETPFDALYTCLKTNFHMFHKNVHLDELRSNVIDEYGIRYPHDYQVKILPTFKGSGDGFKADRLVNEDWGKYIDQVAEKYGRRIERFRNTMTDLSKPIIVLYRDTYQNAMAIKNVLEKTYNREHIIFVVATDQTVISSDQAIVLCNPEAEGKWSDIDIWKNAIETAKKMYSLLTTKPPIVNKRFGLFTTNI